MPYKDKEEQRKYQRERYKKDSSIGKKAQLRRPKGYSNEYYQRKRTKLIEQFGGQCVKCGTTENLEFDHIDRNTKSHKISHLLASSSFQSAVEEAQKCQLLCNSCHIEKTNEFGDNLPHPQNAPST